MYSVCWRETFVLSFDSSNFNHDGKLKANNKTHISNFSKIQSARTRAGPILTLVLETKALR